MSIYPHKFNVGDRVLVGKAKALATVEALEPYLSEEEEDENGDLQPEEFIWMDYRVQRDDLQGFHWYTEADVEFFDDSASHIPEDWS